MLKGSLWIPIPSLKTSIFSPTPSPEDDDFEAAVANTCRALTALIAERVSASMLKYEFDTWSSYHYQPRVAQGARATCRIIFRGTEGSIESGTSATTASPRISTSA